MLHDPCTAVIQTSREMNISLFPVPLLGARLHKTPVTTKGIRTCTRNLSELH